VTTFAQRRNLPGLAEVHSLEEVEGLNTYNKSEIRAISEIGITAEAEENGKKHETMKGTYEYNS